MILGPRSHRIACKCAPPINHPWGGYNVAYIHTYYYMHLLQQAGLGSSPKHTAHAQLGRSWADA
jgi:hypothetical protein